MGVQGVTYYYPSRWIQFQVRTYSAQYPPPQGTFLAELPIMTLQAISINEELTDCRLCSHSKTYACIYVKRMVENLFYYYY